MKSKKTVEKRYEISHASGMCAPWTGESSSYGAKEKVNWRIIEETDKVGRKREESRRVIPWGCMVEPPGYGF
ncbi:hypothetical protein [Bacteroides pyogenes]|uniref:hypothetical protein n=1 Tax=Bacteroides pyogenes TaxID=310300 RepID=UPI003F9F88B5